MHFQEVWERINLFRPKSKTVKGKVLHRIHSVEAFHSILERERARTDRTGLEFSLVVFAIGAPRKSWIDAEGFVNLLARRARFTDEVGWFSEEEIGVILTNTSMEGACQFGGDILQNVTAKASIRSFNIYSYPTRRRMDTRDDCSTFQSPDLFHPLQRAMFQGTSTLPPPSIAPSHSLTGIIDGIETVLVRRLSLLKRVIDIFGSILGLLIFSPLMLAVAASIRLTSPGPLLFRQERVGYLGRTFTLLKFRSMWSNTTPDLHQRYVERFIKNHASPGEHRERRPAYKIIDDPRVTPVGKLLRKTSLDELPQFINVLKGEMSLVGPRPPIPYEYEYYDLWHKRRIWETKPGITGLWQIKGRSKVTFDEMSRLDLQYLRERSLWLDLKILFQTPWAMFTGKGAY